MSVEPEQLMEHFNLEDEFVGYLYVCCAVMDGRHL